MFDALFGRIDPETIAIFIPILTVMGGILIAITAIIVKGRNKDLEHRERLVAMEKGIELPQTAVAAPVERKPAYAARRAGGLVMFGIGFALTIAMGVTGGWDAGVWGLIPLFIGLGLLIAATLDKREYEETQRRKEQSSGDTPTI